MDAVCVLHFLRRRLLSLVAVNHISNLGPHSVVSSAQATGAEDGTLNRKMLNRAGSALNRDSAELLN